MLLKSGNRGGYDRSVMWVGWGKTRTPRILVCKHSEHPTEGTKCKWDDSITTDLTRTHKDGGWMELSHGCVLWLALVFIMLGLWVLLHQCQVQES